MHYNGVTKPAKDKNFWKLSTNSGKNGAQASK